MLFLLFHLDDDRYVVDIDKIVEILPMIEVKKIPGASAEFAGVFNYRGSVVRVLDFSRLISGRPASLQMSTRLIIVRDVSPDEVPQHFGLIVEGVQETIRREQSDFTLPEMDAAAYISAVAADQSGLLYRVDLVKILACLPRAQVTDDVG